MQNFFSLYIRDRQASITVFALVVFTLMVSFAGLIFDVGRIFNLHSQAQAYVDEVALSAAAELDGESGAIQRAIRAAVGDGTAGPILDPGFRLTLSGNNDVGVRRLTFLEDIADDPAPNAFSPVAGDTVLCTYDVASTTLDCGALTQAEAAARTNFVLVDSTNETENYWLFPIAAWFVPGMQTEASVAPQALAGFTREICNFPPMAICNPNESPTGGGSFTADPGDQMLIKKQGPGSSWAPGNFGFLDPPPQAGNGLCGPPNGTNFKRCVLGLVNPNTQCVSTHVDTSPGESVAAHVGINVRFDIFDPPLQNEFNDANFAPDENVTKGYVQDGGNICRSNNLSPWEDEGLPAATEIMPFPKDSNLNDANRIGNGITSAQLDDYWDTNHGTTTGAPAGVTTRYQAYLYEINNSMIPDKSAIGGESGTPNCAPSGVSDRRRMIVAVINCIEHNVQGNDNDVPVLEFMEMFLTDPIGVGGGSEDDVYAEFIQFVEPGGANGVLHEYPVLYR